MNYSDIIGTSLFIISVILNFLGTLSNKWISINYIHANKYFTAESGIYELCIEREDCFKLCNYYDLLIFKENLKILLIIVIINIISIILLLMQIYNIVFKNINISNELLSILLLIPAISFILMNIFYKLFENEIKNPIKTIYDYVHLHDNFKLLYINIGTGYIYTVYSILLSIPAYVILYLRNTGYIIYNFMSV